MKPMAERRFWLIFDVGLTSSFEQLFTWLDDHDATECGDNVATFLHEKSFDKLADELARILHNSGRAYLIGMADPETKRFVGRFIIGRRKAPPWSGYGKRTSPEQKDEA